MARAPGVGARRCSRETGKETVHRILVASGCLKFGDFQLKSATARLLRRSGPGDSGAKLDVVGGRWRRLRSGRFAGVVAVRTAYKGIALAVAAAAAGWYRHGQDLRFFYDRKEAKAHGERGGSSGICRNGGGGGDGRRRAQRRRHEGRSHRRDRGRVPDAPRGHRGGVDRRRRATPLRRAAASRRESICPICSSIWPKRRRRHHQALRRFYEGEGT
jgi:hypothetical protein